MTKQKIAIGLDVGAQSVKMVRMEIKGDSVCILDYKIRDYAEQAEKFSAIKELLGDIGKDVPIVTSIEGSHVFIRVFKLPGVAKSKLNKIVAYEAQQQVPFPIEEVVWSYQCLRRVSPEETDVALTAVKASVVRDFIGSLGLEPSDIIPPVIGLNNLLSWNRYEGIKDPTGQAVMVLDLGAKTTNVIIVEKENLWFRTIPIGGEAITQAIMSEYDIGFSEAEVLKKSRGQIILEGDVETDPDRRRMSTCIIRALTRLCSEIYRSIEVYSSNFNSLGPRKIFITGGGAELGNIGDFFNKKFRVDVDILKTPQKFNLSPDIDKSRFSKDATRLETAFGLALQGLGYGKIRLSLLPGEIIKKYKWMNLQPYITTVSGLAIFLGICFSGYNMQIANIYKTNINKLQNEIRAVDFNKSKIIKAQKDLDIVRNRLDRISELSTSRRFWLEVLLELEGLTPANIWLTGIEPVQEEEEFQPESIYSAGGIIGLRFLGKTTGAYQDIMAFRDALSNSGYFVKDTGNVISASPPLNGVRDFVIEIKAKVK